MIHRVQSVVNNCYTHSHRCVLPSSPPQFWMESAAARTAAPFAMSDLIKECGLPPKSAAAAVKHLRLRAADEANAGPRLVVSVSDPEKHLLPIESQVGISPSDATQVLQRVPENEILHAANNLELIMEVVRSEEKAIRAIRRYPPLLTCDPDKYLIPSINLLRESGVGESSIIYLLTYDPWTILTPPSHLSQVIHRVKKMGIDPNVMMFALAIVVIRSMTKERWEHKMDAYNKWGWSEEVTLKAFTKYPWTMTLSEKKINENMDYYVHQVGFHALDIANSPILLGYSLNKRIVPRDAVLSVLLSKGLIKTRRMPGAFTVTNQMFRERYLKRFKVEAPELSELFERKISENGGSV